MSYRNTMLIWWVVGAVLVGVLLTGCKDYGKCLQSHQEEYTEYDMIWIGQTCYNNVCSPNYIYVPRQAVHTVCDQWEFPNGRPQED